MFAGRSGHTATLLDSGEVLVVGGLDPSGNPLASSELYDPATGSWTSVPPLSEARSGHSGTRLLTGEVVIAGGTGPGGALASVEIFDPQIQRWATISPLQHARYDHTATLLPSGILMIIGGRAGDDHLADVEVLDPALGSWLPGPPLLEGRSQHTATLLRNGNVLVAGGGGDGSSPGFHVALASTEIYSPTSNSWQNSTQLFYTRYLHTATLLPSGNVLFWGGVGTPVSESTTVELLNPQTGERTLTGQSAGRRWRHSSTLLTSGRVLIVGGEDSSGPVSSVEDYDPELGSWSEGPALLTARGGHTSALLPSGKVLVAGGGGPTVLASAEMFDAQEAAWDRQSSIYKRWYHSSVLLPSGQLLIAGGAGLQGTPGAEVYDPWERAAHTVTSPLFYHTWSSATLLPSGRVFLLGEPSDREPSAELYDPDTDSWLAAAPPGENRNQHTATLLPSGEVLVAGGFGLQPNRFRTLVVAYNPLSNTWRSIGDLREGRANHVAQLLLDGRVLIAGGENYDGALSSVEIINPMSRQIVSSRDTDLNLCAPNASAHPESPCPLSERRSSPAAVLLPSGEFLLAGGQQDGTITLATTEIYHPDTGVWVNSSDLEFARHGARATLLPLGQVVVSGGFSYSTGSPVSYSEIFDPESPQWELTSSGYTRHLHQATLLTSGELILTGGRSSSLDPTEAPRYPVGLWPQARRPAIGAVPPIVRYDEVFDVTGIGFGGDSEGSGSTASSSSSNVPMVQLRGIENGRQAWLELGPLPAFCPNDLDPANPLGFCAGETSTLTVTGIPPVFDPGWHLLTVFSNGIPSESKLVKLECSLAVTTHPQDVVVAEGEVATFGEVSGSGARFYQWQQCVGDATTCGMEGSGWVEIPGATGPSYATPPVTPSMSGNRYRVVMDSGCMSQPTEAALLVVADDEEPVAEVVSPDGGEYWLLSGGETGSSTEIVTWSMDDNIRVCRVEVSLVYSVDGGASYLPTPTGGGLPAVFGTGGGCTYPGETTTSLEYTVPTSPPSGQAGSLYKIQVKVTDHAGLTAMSESANPFYIVEPNPDSVDTVILLNSARMEDTFGMTPEELHNFMVAVADLADHPAVNGIVVDLAGVTDLQTLYAEWDADPASATKANLVLLGCHSDINHSLPPDCTSGELDGIHDVVTSLANQIYPQTEYVIVIGDDRIVPMTRIQDRAALFPESNYPSDDPDSELTIQGGSTVALALADDRYLSDDPLAVRDRVWPQALTGQIFLPELSLGRLVETPAEITSSIASFISHDGVLDLGARDPVTGHKVLTTGYDFLIDSGRLIRDRWKAFLGAGSDDGSLAPVDGTLLTPTWNLPVVPDRVAELRAHLGGNGGDPYGVSSLNGHATHFELGVPGMSVSDIQGLPMSDIYGSDACGSPTLGALDLAGSVIYSVGCHSGLSVPGSCALDQDHSLDVAQTALSRGAGAYLGSTGYGWGLVHGIGYGERLVQIFTEELSRGGPVVVGHAARTAKIRYHLEAQRFDAYDEKTLMQWALYGFPMFKLLSGDEQAAVGRSGFKGLAPTLKQLGSPSGTSGPIRSRRLSALGGPPPPPFLVSTRVLFDLTASGVFAKRNALGESISEPGCPDPAPGEPAGCYYTLNGVATGSTDLPIEPYFVFSSRLSGTSQHGVLWAGGTYDEEQGWEPIFAELVSNGGDGSNHGATPRHILLKPRPPRALGGADPACSASDLEVSSVVVPVGEVLQNDDPIPSYSIHRTYRNVDLEMFFFNNTASGAGNCDRSGPEFGAPTFGDVYHEVGGTAVRWAVPASDAGGVWRVLVVFTDHSLDENGQGRWVPVELESDGSVWTGEISVSEATEITYVIQAVDNRGNVSWFDFVAEELPASGVPVDLPATTTALIAPGSADLALSLRDAPDPVGQDQLLRYTAVVVNLGPDTATDIRVTDTLPTGSGYVVGGGTDWSCHESAGLVTCHLDQLDPGSSSSIDLFVDAPSSQGTIVNQASVEAFEADADSSNNTELEVTQVGGADLAITKTDGGAVVGDGWPLTYTITVINYGPEPVVGAIVTDIFPPEFLDPTWVCTACGSSGRGDIMEAVNLPSRGFVTFLATGTVAMGAPGMLENTATVEAPTGLDDPNSLNNSATIDTWVIPNLIFGDGFESGGTSRWSSAVGGAQDDTSSAAASEEVSNRRSLRRHPR
ncbi:MAG: hypothetical protein KDD11_22465 [Acidobacteria bacterium]|nr:hypothetical protein [Acidobacteriota bacterium]